MARLGRTRAAALVVAAVVALGVAATAPSASADDGAATQGEPAGAVTCDYLVIAWDTGLSADVRIVNNGPVIDGWTVDLTFEAPTTLGAAWSALMSQPDPVTMVAENVSYNRLVPSEGAVTFGWVAAATSHEVPTMSVNGVPC
jgi:hypothetical protein